MNKPDEENFNVNSKWTKHYAHFFGKVVTYFKTCIRKNETVKLPINDNPYTVHSCMILMHEGYDFNIKQGNILFTDEFFGQDNEAEVTLSYDGEF